MKLLGFILYIVVRNIHADSFNYSNIEAIFARNYGVQPTLNFTTKCFDGLGCYYNGPPFFNPITRPISLLPSDNPELNVDFLLYTPKNKEENENHNLKLTKESLQNSNFNPNSKTMIWVQGWPLTNSEINAMQESKNALFEHTKDYYNFFIVNWARYGGEFYEQAVANLRVVGTLIAKLIQFLMKTTNAPLESFHLVGHSIGAHGAGYAGQELPGVRRITALDAASPYFFYTDKEVRLDPTDALFVDAIHTNGGLSAFDGFGLLSPYGDQDFYPNGGQSQPGCGHGDPYTVEMIQHNVIRRLMIEGCDHERSLDYFLESIKYRNCTFLGTQCDSYKDWKKGKCPSSTHPVAVMGLRAKPIPGLTNSKFYLDTGKSNPYCFK